MMLTRFLLDSDTYAHWHAQLKTLQHAYESETNHNVKLSLLKASLEDLVKHNQVMHWPARLTCAGLQSASCYDEGSCHSHFAHVQLSAPRCA